MKDDRVIIIADTYNSKKLLCSFEHISKYIKCFVGFYDNENTFLGLPTYQSIDDAFKDFDSKSKVVVSVYNDYQYTKDVLVNNYGKNPDDIIELRVWLLHILKTTNIIHMPHDIRFDVCTICQLNCSGCYMRLYNNADHGRGYLKFEQFKKFIDENKYLESIEISNSGEVFLNPDIDKILEYAYNNGVIIHIANGVNFNSVSEKTIEALVKYNVVDITFSIDGASQETYPIYRRNGNFNKVIENIKLLNKYKKKYKSETPALCWQYVLMDHNECEIEKAIDMAKELNMQLVFKKDWRNNYKPKDPQRILELTGLNYKEEHNESPYCFSECIQMLISPQINWDGRIFGCCVNCRASWNLNVLNDGLLQCLNSVYYRNALYRLLGDPDAKKNDDPCTKCWYFDLMDKEHKYLGV